MYTKALGGNIIEKYQLLLLSCQSITDVYWMTYGFKTPSATQGPVNCSLCLHETWDCGDDDSDDDGDSDNDVVVGGDDDDDS